MPAYSLGRTLNEASKFDELPIDCLFYFIEGEQQT